MNQKIEPIGIVHSPYKQKFAIPRQPNLVSAGTATIELYTEFGDINCLREIEQFSHLWIIFLFHGTAEQGWSPTVQPPRLGGQDKVGVFASRSPFRPNPIGISAVEYSSHQRVNSKSTLEVKGIDLLDGTPVLDIKPYIPYADSIESAVGGYAEAAPNSGLSVIFTDAAQVQIDELNSIYPELRELITQVLTQDPRPAWRVKDNDEKQYGMTLYNLNIKWAVNNGSIAVTSILPEES
ncbi:MAG: tRNA (N6-threonylcarbamoyladenosine(37)-N6)-methyltransferase TrmO [Pseudomonadales bacterium]|nr:tRNA (N6-threonylcarbamoyladenosine(37)-N6)-methyltransferase TrmO [Pseudomonadales bacterium]